MLASACGVALIAAEVLLRSCSPIGDPFPDQRRVELGAYIPNRHAPNFEISARAEPGLPGLSGTRRFVTSEDGFVGDDLATTPSDARRVFLVGGSTMECMVLGEQGNPATLLQARLTSTSTAGRFVVLNAGHSGDASFDHVAVLAHRIAHLRPSVVVFLTGVNDLVAGLRGEDYAHLHPDQTIELTGGALLRLASTRLQVGRLVVTALGGGRLRRWDADDPVLETHYRDAARACAALPRAGALPELPVEAYARNLRTLVAVTRAAGAEPILMTQPHSWRTAGPLGDWHWMTCHAGQRYDPSALADALDRYNEVTRRTALDTGAELIDLARLMPADESALYDDVHFNLGGARVLAERLAEALLR